MQTVEEPLKCPSTVGSRGFGLCRDLVDSLSEKVGEIQRLQKGVEIAGCALVLQSDHASLFLRVVAEIVVNE